MTGVWWGADAATARKRELRRIVVTYNSESFSTVAAILPGKKNMSKEWWPALLAHVPNENPWDHDDVIVSEIKSFDEKPYAGQRRAFTALVPMDQIDTISSKFAKLSCEISTSGPFPFYSKSHPFKPEFWIEGYELPAARYEPLVLCWNSHDRTVLQPDPGFLMTYGLIPRAINGGAVRWDDPRAPKHDIVTVTEPSVWKFPMGTHAYVSISKEYLQDYLTLRNVALVEIFWEKHWGLVDSEIQARIGDEEAVDLDFSACRIHLGKAMDNPNHVFAQIWGARLLAKASTLPISADPLDEEGLSWPGFETSVTNDVARHFGVLDYAFVDDAVLGIYEGHKEFSITPSSGGVSFGTQWSVGFCKRIGRNLIQLELKKLYEGAPAAVIRDWHKFAVKGPPDSAYPAVRKERNVAQRASEIVCGVVRLGEALSGLSESLGLTIAPEQFVGLRRSALDYSGWWTFPSAEAIGRHIPIRLSVDAFLDRCMSLHKLTVEGLSEGGLRRILVGAAIPKEDLKDLRSLKLLDSIVCLATLVQASGLTFAQNGSDLWQRLIKDVSPPQPISYLFALNDTRILKAHKSSDREEQLQLKLERFGIGAGEEVGGYGKILDHIYDLLSSELTAASEIIEAAIE
jgi:hypothetical protein